MNVSVRRRKPVALLFVLSMIAVLLVAAGAPASGSGHEWTLTILHNNDGESQLIDAGSGLEDFGGAARFKTVLDDLRAAAATDGTILVSSGDNFLAGPEFNASLDKGVPFYDTIAADAFGYDALAFGNHDFDFGPGITADFIAGFTATKPPFWVAANLDFSAEPGLQALVDDGTINASITITVSGEDVGIIGLDTPNLPFVSSPGGVVVDDDLAAIVQAEIDALEGAGVDKIVLISHLQNIDTDVALAAELSGIDVIVGGGGDELLANPGDTLLPGDVADPALPYPILATDADGGTVPVVTTSGSFRYVGKLEVTFDAAGEVTGWSGGPVRVEGTPDATLQASVVDPLVADLAALASDILTTSTVDLDGRRSEVRSRETNEGNLVADALLWQAIDLAGDFDVDVADVALQNGGGIRNDAILPAGDISVLDTFDILPFSNFLTVLEGIESDQFKEILENAVACTQPGDFAVNPNCGSGRFAQVAGFEFVWDPSGTGQILDDDANVLVPGTRVETAILDDGTAIVLDGIAQAGAPTITVATADFLAKGGDQYPFRGHPFTILGVTYQRALQNFLAGGPKAVIEANYPEGGEGRITLTEAEPAGARTLSALWFAGPGGPFYYGDPGDQFFAGDWDCDGRDTPGLLRSGTAYLRNSNDAGVADITYLIGDPGDVGLAGDFDGDGCDSVSVYRPSNQTVYLFNDVGPDGGAAGAATMSFAYGDPGDVPFVADYDGDGTDTIGVQRANDFYLRNSNDQGNAEVNFTFGAAGDQPVFGDWNGDGVDTVATYQPGPGEVSIRFSNTTGPAEAFRPAITGPATVFAGRFG